MSSKILLRRGTAAQWSSANPILGIGELGIETDTLKIKIGNGTSTWTQLTSYANVTPSQLTSEINNLINAAPSTLDTLNELAAAINNDASFSTTVNNLLTGKVSKSGGDTITSGTASTVGLIVKGAASQTADLQQWQNSAGTALTVINANGVLISTTNAFINDSAGASTGLQVKRTISQIGIYGSDIGLIVKGAASQTANLQEWQNSAGTAVANVDPSGHINTIGYVGLGLNAGIVVGGSYVIRNNYASNNSINIGNSVSPQTAAQVQVTNSAAGIVGLIVKGASSQTGNLQEWQDSGGTQLGIFNAYGTFTANNRIYAGWAAFGSGYGTSASASNVVLIAKGSASQTANLQEWQNSAGTVLAKVDANGDITLPNGISTSNGVLTATGLSSSYAVGIGLARATGNANLAVTTGSTTNVGILVRGVASQTADLQQWQNNSGGVLAKTDTVGSFTGTSFNASGYVSTNSSGGTYTGYWCKLADLTLPYQYTDANMYMDFYLNGPGFTYVGDNVKTADQVPLDEGEKEEESL